MTATNELRRLDEPAPGPSGRRLLATPLLRAVIAVVLVLIGGVLARVHLGPLTLVAAAGLWIACVGRGSLLTRLVPFGLFVCLGIMVLAVAGPVVPALFGPTAVGGVCMLPAAAAFARAGLRRQRLRGLLPVDDVVILAAAGGTAWLFARAFIGASRTRQLAKMVIGGYDYLSHFDYMQMVWFHHGFMVVRPHAAILEPRPLITATPYGAHVLMTAAGMLASGQSALPSTAHMFRLFVAVLVVIGIVFVAVMSWTCSHLLGALDVPVGLRVPAILGVAAISTLGPFGSLYASGFASFLVGLAVAVIAMVLIATAKPEAWRWTTLLITIAIIIVAYSYTLILPVLLAAWLAHAWWQREQWSRTHSGRKTMATFGVLLLVASAGASLPLIPGTSALAGFGGVVQIQRGLLFSFGFGCILIAALARHLLHPAVIRLVALSAFAGGLVILFAIEQIAALGDVRYYPDKLAYVWLALSFLALLAELTSLAVPAYHLLTVQRRRRFVALACLIGVWSFGYVGPVPFAVTDRFNSPITFAWSDVKITRAQLALANELWTLPPRPGLTLFLGPLAHEAVDMWFAVLHRQSRADISSLTLAVGGQPAAVAAPALESWIGAHPNAVINVYALQPSWLRVAQNVVAATGTNKLRLHRLYLPG